MRPSHASAQIRYPVNSRVGSTRECTGFSSGWIPVSHRSQSDRWARSFATKAPYSSTAPAAVSSDTEKSDHKNQQEIFFPPQPETLPPTTFDELVHTTPPPSEWHHETVETLLDEISDGPPPEPQRSPVEGKNQDTQLLKSLNLKRDQFRAMFKPTHQHQWLTLRHPLNQSLEHPALSTNSVATQSHAFTRTTYCSNWAINLRWRSSWWTKLHKRRTHKTTVWKPYGDDVWDPCYASTCHTSLRLRNTCASASFTSPSVRKSI